MNRMQEGEGEGEGDPHRQIKINGTLNGSCSEIAEPNSTYMFSIVGVFEM
jgi:hypothetical protein